MALRRAVAVFDQDETRIGLMQWFLHLKAQHNRTFRSCYHARLYFSRNRTAAFGVHRALPYAGQ